MAEYWMNLNIPLTHIFGKITILNQQNLTPDMIKVDYYYLTSINSEHSIKGLGTQTYSRSNSI